MSDARPSDPPPPSHQVEIAVDFGAFLPETTAIGPVEPVAEPEGAAIDEGHEPPAAVADAGVAEAEVAKAPEVDVAVLAGIEADLAAVDQAIEAIDSGDHGRSPLLTELLGPPPG